MLSQVVSYILDVVNGLGYTGIFVMMAMESTILPIPSEIVMIPAGYLVYKGQMAMLPAVFAGGFGSLFGSLCNYYIAAKFGRRFLEKYGKYFLIKERQLHKIESFFIQHGQFSIFIGRLLPVARHIISIPAGIARMNLYRFSIFTLLGALIWSFCLLLMGYWLGGNKNIITQKLILFKSLVVVCGLGSVGVYAYYVKKIRPKLLKLHQKKSSYTDVIITAGGTGGHIFPAINFAKELILQHKTVYFVTDIKFLRYRDLILSDPLLNEKNFKYIINPIKPLNKFSIFNIIHSIIHCIIKLRKIRADFIVGFGGYAAFPTCIYAFLSHKILIIHEQNAVFGKVNKMFIGYASYVITTFRDTKLHNNSSLEPHKNKILNLGLPIDKKFISTHKNRNQTDIFKILILGGSQGSNTLSFVWLKTLPTIIQEFPDIKFEIYHQIGANETPETLNKFYNQYTLSYQVAKFFNNVNELMNECNLLISRAGASAVVESSIAGIPAIFIPLANAIYNHQFYNANYLFKKGGCLMLNENELLDAKLMYLSKNYTFEDLNSTDIKIIENNLFKRIKIILKDSDLVDIVTKNSKNEFSSSTVENMIKLLSFDKHTIYRSQHNLDII